MDGLLAVAVVLAVATFVTGLLLPLTSRGTRDDARHTDRDAALAAELGASR